MTPQLWEPGTQYNYDSVVEYNGKYYKIIQPHRSQGDWTPDVTPALWGRTQGPAAAQQPPHPPAQQYGTQQPIQQQQQQQPPPPQYTDDKHSQPQGPRPEEEKKSWVGEHKTELGVAGAVLGAATLAGGIFAYKKHQDDKETVAHGYNAWLADAEARAGQYRQFGSQSPATWVLNRGKNIPGNAILVGKERDWNLYIARGYIQGSVQVGKASNVFKEGAVVGFGGDEHNLDTYEILVGNMNQLKWVPTSGRLNVNNLAARPVEGGREADGTPLYIAKAFHKGAEHPGKASEKLDAAFIPYGNDEEKVKQYSVLCYA